ncbi:MAG: pitrilysin family protein [Sphingopyxis sp.]
MRLSIFAAAIIGLSSPALAENTAQPASGLANDPAVAALVERIDIPYERFTLDNGLTVVVHTDRKAPVVAVSVWYDVGSKDEPVGSTGFAHLFEHLMFNGSENASGDFFTWLQDIGATDTNGTTNHDRTNYFETVPTGALDRALWLESDRMGHLLGAVTQEVLDNQRGVVQNEKRQGDNQPFGLFRYYMLENLIPAGHPYRHSAIGSMADLNAASLDTVQNWFRSHYGPNNAVLVLAGDIDAATARPMVERWFGGIARGPDAVEPRIEVPTLPAPLAREVVDRIATTRLYRMWTVPGWSADDSTDLQVAASVLGGLSSSRLDNALVRGEQLAVSVSASAWAFEDVGVFFVQADVLPGADVAQANRRLDEIVNQFIAEGPNEDEIRRTVMSGLSGQLDGLESVGGFGGKAVALAQGQLFAGNPGHFRHQLQRFVGSTPVRIRETTQRWLSRPVFSLTYTPGTRTDTGDGHGGNATSAAAADPLTANYYRPPTSANERAMGAVHGFAMVADEQSTPAPTPAPAPAAAPTPAREPPALGPIGDLDFPAIERGRLRNGIPVYFARRTAVPVVRAAIVFDAGSASDPRDRLGTQMLMLNLMDEGTTTLDSTALAEAQERLGTGISTYSSNDNSGVGLYALTTNMRSAMALWADVVRNPAFAPAEVERIRAQQLAGIAAELNSPMGLASRVLMPALYGREFPYGGTAASGTVSSVRAITSDELVASHQRWIRPDNAAIYIVGDTNLRDVVRELNRAFGDWRAPAAPRGTKDFSAAIPELTPRILMVNRPNSPQSIVMAAHVMNVRGRDDLVNLRAANDVLGANFLSRINMDLRETKGWSYGSRSIIGSSEDRIAFSVFAPVQADHTGDTIRAIQEDVGTFLTTRGVTADELSRTANGSIRELPGEFETAESVLGGISTIIENNRSDTYYEELAARYRAMTAAQMDAAIRAQVDPSRFVYIVVGDAAIVRPQLDALGLPVEEVDTATLGGQ